MAWRSSGNDNDDMVNNLTRFGVISTPEVEAAFRSVDRLHFVPQTHTHLAHSDQPLKENNVHISAPHIYGTIVESLDLKPGSSHSFLNIGSGTGYVSCVVSQILGPDSCMFGVEIYQDVIDHCKASIKRWKDARNESNSNVPTTYPSMEFICGNGLEIDPTKGESHFGFDRIYVGAAVSRSHLIKIANLLRPGGILVAPVEDDLVKVTRLALSDTKASNEESSLGSSVLRSSRTLSGSSPSLSDDFSMQIVSGVRFAPLLRSPSSTTVIPCKIWDPSIHPTFPKCFKESITEILLCSQASTIQPPKIVVESEHINLASTLPKDIWIKILSYTHRSWFEQPHKVDEVYLRQRLVQEQQTAQRAKEACAEAERRMRLAERERDGYKLLAMRWKLRLRAVLNDTNKSNTNNASPSRSNGSTNSATRTEDPLLLMDDLAQAAAFFLRNDSNGLFPRTGRRGHRFAYHFDDGSNADDDNGGDDDEEDDENTNNEADDMNLDGESEFGDTNNDMDEISSDGDDSEDLTIAASPDTSDGSFFRQVSTSIQNQSFFT